LTPRLTNEFVYRWEQSAVSLLPDYLKMFYLKLISIFKEFEDEMEPREKYRVAFSRKAVWEYDLLFVEKFIYAPP
jgi:(-)-germacrene D synthase